MRRPTLHDAHRLLPWRHGLEPMTPEAPEVLARPITSPVLIAQADARYSPDGTDHLESATWRRFWLNPDDYRITKHVPLLALTVVTSGQDELGVDGYVGVARVPANATTELHTFSRSVTHFNVPARTKIVSPKFVLSDASVYAFTLGLSELPKGTGSIWAQLHVVGVYPEADLGVWGPDDGID